MDARRLTSPSTPVPFHHATPAIDHNLYIDGRYVFEFDYTAGLRVLDYDKKSLSAGKLREVAYFDVFPASDLAEFLGTWSNYPYFESGNVVVNAIDSGLFVLRPELMR